MRRQREAAFLMGWQRAQRGEEAAGGEGEAPAVLDCCVELRLHRRGPVAPLPAEAAAGEQDEGASEPHAGDSLPPGAVPPAVTSRARAKPAAVRR